MEQKTGIGALYAKIFRGYGAISGPFWPGSPSNWTYNQPYTRWLRTAYALGPLGA